MNPFSGFLQPPQQRSPLAGAGEFMADMSRLSLARQQEANRVKEAGTDNARADQYLKLQQTDQASRLVQQDQKQVEALLAEYQDAEDQGDPIRLSRAAQMLKRFGMDVSPGKTPALAGALPSPASLQSLTGQTDPDLPQSEFEEQLIESTQAAPARYEVGGETAPEFKKQIGLDGALPVDLGDVDSPEFKAAASAEAVDMGDVDSPEFRKAARDEQRPELKNTAPPQLSGGLPTVVSRGGKTLYESTGPSGRWSPMVQGVFQPFTAHANPDIAAAAERAKQVTGKLIEVDGIAPKDAIKMGMDYLNGEANRITNLARTELGTRPKWGGGGSTGGAYSLGAGGKADAALNDDADKVRTMWVNSAGYKKMEEQAGLLDDAEGGLMSPDGVAQNNALATLRRIQSGLTLNASEMRDFEGAAGALEAVKKKFSRLMGEGQLPDEYKRQVQGTMSHMRGIIQRRMQRGAEEAYQYFLRTRSRSAAPDIVREKGEAIRESLQGGSAPTANPDSEEALY